MRNYGHTTYDDDVITCFITGNIRFWLNLTAMCQLARWNETKVMEKTLLWQVES
jgi:hypothetical protein